MEHQQHKRGSICATLLHTSDTKRAAAFYTALLGWTSRDHPDANGSHLLFQADGKTVAGVQQSSTLNEWIPHVSVDDVESTTQSAATLGGAAIERVEVPGLASLAVLRDPEGARFGLWAPSPVEGVQLTDDGGSLWWVEVLSDDPPRAKQFYSSLFGWQTRETAFDPFDAYTVFERDGVQEGGVLPIGRDWGVTPHWNSIFAVDDCDATMRRACELGGSAGFVHTVPKHGRVGSAIDPNGAWLWLRGPVPAKG
jgi:predicted enzyme related to lactoylglutathione lyase